MITLRPITREECELVRQWRNAPDVLPMLRTGAKTVEEQAAFYRDVIENPHADHRYYAVEHKGSFVGMGGLTYLSRTAGEAEISLLLGPDARGRGLGSKAVDALLAEAWRLGLTSVIGECVRAGPMRFWQLQIFRYSHLVDRNVWNRERESMCWRWSIVEAS